MPPPETVIELNFTEIPIIDPALTIDPEAITRLPVEFADVGGLKKSEKRWM